MRLELVIKENAHRRCDYHNIRWALVAADSFHAATIVGVPISCTKYFCVILPKKFYVVIVRGKHNIIFQYNPNKGKIFIIGQFFLF